MAWLYLIRHPHTRQDPEQPASSWDVSERGRAEIAALVAAPFWHSVAAVYTSPQRKAALVGEAVAAAHGLPHTIVADLTEAGRDRWLAGENFGAVQHAFFTQPDVSPVEGWESARSALVRFDAAMAGILAGQTPDQSLAVVAHASVLTLYVARLRSEAPTLAAWRAIGFAAVLAPPRKSLRPVGTFVTAPYTSVPG